MRVLIIFCLIFVSGSVLSAPALPDNLITQDQIESGDLTLSEIRHAGLRVFATAFNKEDGLGDGNPDPSLPIGPIGNRVGLATSHTPLSRINGLDSQTCLECHNIRSALEFPTEFAIGGAGGISQNALAGILFTDMTDAAGNGFADIDGRFINPPFTFGAGGVELLAKEMTADLQRIRSQLAISSDGTTLLLISKGISFGSISKIAGKIVFNTNGWIDDDLVVKPFGRKGNNETVRVFDQGAMPFHHGMEPEEIVGTDVDGDNDGVVNEVTIGEMSALSVFLTSMPPPTQDRRMSRQARRGKRLFYQLGCAGCHTPKLITDTTHFPLSFPEVHEDSSANVYLTMDLAKQPIGFRREGRGIAVHLFSDLRRHDMGPELAERTGGPLDPFFVTPRLWGIADTAPYLHDGRALTLVDAIKMHGGEAQQQSDAFKALSLRNQNNLVAFLKTLRTPTVRQIDKLVKRLVHRK